MELARSFLDRYKHVKPKGDEVRRVTAEVLNDEFGVELSKRDMTVKNGTAFAPVPSIVKSEIQLRKAALLKEIRGRLTEDSISDIR